MASITIDISGVEGLSAMRAFLDPKLYDKALRGGISYASKAVPPAVAKGIRAEYAISSARIKQDISPIQFGSGGQTATIRFSRRPPTLTQYGARPGTRATGQRGLGRGMGWSQPSRPGRPVTAIKLKREGRKPEQGAFIATGLNGNQVVLRRSSDGSKLYGVYGPSIGSIYLGRSAIAQQLQADVSIRINEQFIRGVQRVLDSAARGYGSAR